MSNLNMAQKEEGVVEDTSSSLSNEDTSSSISNVIIDFLCNPLHWVLIAACMYLLRKIFSHERQDSEVAPRIPELPPMKKRDMTYQELKKYDGLGEDGRVCVAVNGKVFDVTKGKRFYGPGAPYASFAGRDASRCLATFSVDEAKEEYDDLSDLNSLQMDSVREWEIQFQERYEYVGRLLKPGEEPTDYSDEEEPSQERDQSTLETQSSPSSSNKDE